MKPVWKDFPFWSAAPNGPAVCWQRHSMSRSNYKHTQILKLLSTYLSWERVFKTMNIYREILWTYTLYRPEMRLSFHSLAFLAPDLPGQLPRILTGLREFYWSRTTGPVANSNPVSLGIQIIQKTQICMVSGKGRNFVPVCENQIWLYVRDCFCFFLFSIFSTATGVCTFTIQWENLIIM